jgi:hypothetical protein
VDKVKTSTRLEEILAEWDLEPDSQDTITISASQASPYTVTTAINLPNAIYTTGTGTTTAPWATFNPNTASTKIQLNGENADITVNGWSLVDAVKRIEERLDLYQPNPELEAEWEDLRALGDKYRELEQHIRDKQATFDRLKAMPKLNIDT